MHGLVRRDFGVAVVAALSGGLGNQMFQYAAGRSLAIRCGGGLILDATVFALPAQRRSFALSDFQIDAHVIFDGYAYPPVGSVAELPRRNELVPHRMKSLGQLVLSAVELVGRRSGRRERFSVFKEASFDYDPRFAELGVKTYLTGYWQSARYFHDARDVIRKELQPIAEPNALNAIWLARIAESNAVCIHVRRGDYLMAAHFDHHGVCSAQYYRRAMQVVRDRLDNPRFFVFSDDWQWSRENLSANDVVIVDANDETAARDELRLMAACRHHIIANSSLSWWAAWLARAEGQIVIAPKPWFTKKHETPDLLPETWLTLSRDP